MSQQMVIFKDRKSRRNKATVIATNKQIRAKFIIGSI